LKNLNSAIDYLK